MRSLVIWNACVAIALGSVYALTLRLLLGNGGAGRMVLKTLGIVLLTGATTPYVAPALRSVAAPVFPKTRVERAIESLETRLAALPEWRERTRGRSRTEMLEIAHELGFRGVSRLDDDSLATATGMLASILADVDVSTCGRMVKGKLSNTDVAAVVVRRFERADRETLDGWMDVLYAAASAELTGRQVLPPAARDVSGAMQLLLSRMSRQDGELLRHTLLGIKRADDEHACWAARTLYYYLPQLPDQARRDLTRAAFAS